MKSCAILQPHYLPWVGYFEMIDRVDVFVFLDDVQFIKREWKNRNRIRKTHNHAEGKWLSVPVNRADQHGLLTEAHLFTGEDWAAGHLNAIRDTYGRSPFFADVFPLLKTALRGVRDTVLSELNIGLIDALCCILGITTERIKSSDLGVSGKREEKLLNICQAIGTDFYLANNATASYVGADYFTQHGIAFATQDYEHPVYPQTSAGHNLPPLSHLSIIDVLFNVGIGADALEIIRKGRP